MPNTTCDIRQRVFECCDLLTQAGYPVGIHDVEAESPRFPGSINIIAALEHKGYANGWYETLPLFREHWLQVRSPRLTIEQAIDAIHSAGGIAVLAHPIAVRC